MRAILRVLGIIALVILIVVLWSMGTYGTARIASRGWFYGRPDPVVNANVTVECTVTKTCNENRHSRQAQPATTKQPARANQPVTPARPQPAPTASKDVLDIHVHAEGEKAIEAVKVWGERRDNPCCEPPPCCQPMPTPTPQRVQTPDEPLLQTAPASAQPSKSATTPAIKPSCKGSRPPCGGR